MAPPRKRAHDEMVATKAVGGRRPTRELPVEYAEEDDEEEEDVEQFDDEEEADDSDGDQDDAGDYEEDEEEAKHRAEQRADDAMIMLRARAAAGGAAGGANGSSKRDFINDREGLEQALADIKRNLPWVESLDVTASTPLHVDDVDDDLKREVQFYNQTLQNVKAARAKLEALGITNHKRPDDYFADMLKSTQHMQKIKDKLIFEQKKMQVVEARRKAKESAQFAKQVHSERVKERAAEKKASEESVKRWRKLRASRSDDADDSTLEQAIQGKSPAGGGVKGALPRKSGKRTYKDKKYGFGGKKRGKKDNTRESSSDLAGFNPKKMKATGPGMGKKKAPKNAGANRPGKRARVASRNQRG